MKAIVRSMLVRLGALLYGVRARIGEATLPRFASTPRSLRIDLPRNVSNPDRIWFGEDVELGPGCFLIAVTGYPSRKMRSTEVPMEEQRFDPVIRFGDRVTATAQLQVFAQRSVTIGDDAMFATNVYINDGSHGYATADVPYKYQPIERIAPVTIGNGCWIGQNVVIMPGVTIGDHALIGANSVVTRDVPPRTIAAGAPARVRKRWDEDSGTWTSEKGGSST